MTKLRLNITTSLDGYVAGPNQDLAHTAHVVDQDFDCAYYVFSSRLKRL
jgi:hypothetical protein